MNRVLVISPHPDDETIGCGGTLRKHILSGDIVHVVFLTSGESGGHGLSPEETIKVREKEAQVASAILGITNIQFWRLKDGECRATRNVIDKVRSKLKQFKPNFIYVPHNKETHFDHRAPARIVRRALKNSKSNKNKTSVYMFEVWTPLQRIDHIEEISPYIGKKLEAIRAYKTQCNVMGFEEAFKGLARYRGVMHSWYGSKYAEVFEKLEL